MRIRITVVHQWWLDVNELRRLLFSGEADLVSSEMCPWYTDCTTSVFMAPSGALSRELTDALPPGWTSATPGSGGELAFYAVEASGIGRLDERLVSLTVERCGKGGAPVQERHPGQDGALDGRPEESDGGGET